MKKVMKKNANRKIALILLIIMVFNMIIPIHSNAMGVISSVISKPIASLFMILIDDVNRSLATMFALDSKAKNIDDDIKDAWNNTVEDFNSDQNFLQKFESAMDNAEDVWYNLLLSPDDIFYGNVKIANANIFTADNSGFATLTSFGHLIDNIKETVAGLYYIMRNLAAVILLCLLIYCGIRIVLSSANAGEKAKWKMYLFDWLKALALVMFVHVIMIGIFYVAETVIEGLKGGITGGSTLVTELRKGFNDVSIFDGGTSWIYLIMYGYVTYLTIVFLVAYFKRFLYIMVMIVIAPIISALYALGKTTKNAFNDWLKEFTMGVMVQPFHMLIYSVLIVMPIKMLNNGSIVDDTLIDGTPITILNYTTIDVKLYALFALSSIRPIEKYMRKRFGFGSTSLDNMASFESGKRTIDQTKKAVKQAVDTTVKVAGTVALGIATGGAGLAAGGAGGALGGLGGAAGEAGGIGLEGMNMPLGEMGDSSFLSDLSPDLMQEGNLLDSEDQALLDLTPDPSNMGNWTDADEQALNELYDEQIQRRDDYDERKQKYLEEQDRNNSAKNSESQRDGLSSERNGQDAVFNNANVQINQADTMEVNSLNSLNADTIDSLEEGEKRTDSGENTEKGNTKTEDKNNLNEKVKIEESGNDRPKLFGGPLAMALGSAMDKYRQVKSEVESNPIYQAVTAPDTKNSIQDLKSAMHELGDTMYIPGDADPSLWKTNIDYKKTEIKKQEEKLHASFVNDKDNEKKVIEALGLKDKKDAKTGEIIKTKEDQAKEKLKDMLPYVSAGIQDVDRIIKIQSKGNDVESAMKQDLKDNITEGIARLRINNFSNNTNNFEVMRNIVADRMNIPQERRSEPTIIQQINQQVNQDFKEGAKYITSGAAKDSETLNRLLQLERKIDEKVDMQGSVGASKATYVVNADKAIQKAMDKKLKTVKLPGADKNLAVKELQKVLNDELKTRRESSGNSNQNPDPSPNNNSRQKPIGGGNNN